MKILKSKTFLTLLVLLSTVGFFTTAFLMNERPKVPEVQSDPAAHSGYSTVSMLVDLMQAQLEGRGGWLPNDPILTPGYFLDNVPNFQLGVLQILRHGSRVLRDNLTRQRTSDAVHKEVDLAYSKFANDPFKWWMPSAEGAFMSGSEALRRFRADLGGQALFYPRADNLVQLLEAIVSELGATNTRLMRASEPGAVSWFQIDDNFYYAQGVAHASLGLLRAVKVDFDKVLTDKNAMEILDLILKSLEDSQFNPLLVTNGDKAGLMANHSNNLKAFLDDARQKLNSLISILRQG